MAISLDCRIIRLSGYKAESTTMRRGKRGEEILADTSTDMEGTKTRDFNYFHIFGRRTHWPKLRSLWTAHRKCRQPLEILSFLWTMIHCMWMLLVTLHHEGGGGDDGLVEKWLNGQVILCVLPMSTVSVHHRNHPGSLWFQKYGRWKFSMNKFPMSSLDILLILPLTVHIRCKIVCVCNEYSFLR